MQSCRAARCLLAAQGASLLNVFAQLFQYEIVIMAPTLPLTKCLE